MLSVRRRATSQAAVRKEATLHQIEQTSALFSKEITSLCERNGTLLVDLYRDSLQPNKLGQVS